MSATILVAVAEANLKENSIQTPAVFWLLLAKEKLFEGNLHQRLVSEYTISPN